MYHNQHHNSSDIDRHSRAYRWTESVRWKLDGEIEVAVKKCFCQASIQAKRALLGHGDRRVELNKPLSSIVVKINRMSNETDEIPEIESKFEEKNV